MRRADPRSGRSSSTSLAPGAQSLKRTRPSGCTSAPKGMRCVRLVISNLLQNGERAALEGIARLHLVNGLRIGAGRVDLHAPALQVLGREQAERDLLVMRIEEDQKTVIFQRPSALVHAFERPPVEVDAQAAGEV